MSHLSTIHYEMVATVLKYDFHVIYAGKNQTTGLAFSSHYNFYQKLASDKARTYKSWSKRCTGLFLQLTCFRDLFILSILWVLM